MNIGLRRRAAGFTLVELLVGLAIIGLITMLLFAALRTGQRAWEVTDARAQRTADLRLARDFLRRSLGNARAVAWREGDKVTPLFWGDGGRLEWVAPAPDYVGYGGLALWRLEAESTDAGRRLVLHRWMYHPQALAAVPTWTRMGVSPAFGRSAAVGNALYSEHVLVEGLSGFALRYLQRQQDGDHHWVGEWLDQSVMPIAVGLQLQAGTAAWPELVVRLPDGTGRNTQRRAPPTAEERD